MKETRFDLKGFVLQSYVLDVLKELKSPKRFSNLAVKVQNRGTLAVKLSKMKKLGLIQTVAMKVDDSYVNSYTLSKKGKRLLKVLEKL